MCSVALKVPVPFVNVELPGSTASPSLAEKLTVPAYAGVVLPPRSVAVTVKLKPVPAVCGDPAVTINI